MATRFIADAASSALVHSTEEAVIRLLMERFGALWDADGAPPSVDLEEIRRIRGRYFMPLVVGALRASGRLMWNTAPPGSDPASLQFTLESNLRILVAEISAELPAGAFWSLLEADLAGTPNHG